MSTLQIFRPRPSATFQKQPIIRQSNNRSIRTIEQFCFFFLHRHTVTAAVQACVKLTDEDKDREIEGLRKAMEAFSLPSGTIVTEDQRDRLTFGKRHIDIIPFWDWNP